MLAPYPRHSYVVEEGASALAKTHAPRNASGGEEERRAERTVRRHGEVEALAAKPARRAEEAERPPIASPLVVEQHVVHVGMVGHEGCRFGSDQDREPAGRDLLAQRRDERRGQNDVAEKARLHDEQRRPGGLIRDAGLHRSA